MLVGILMIAMDKLSTFHMQLVFSVDTWKNQVKSMEMGASNIEAQVLVSGFDHVFAYIILHRSSFLYPVPPLLALF